MPPHSSLSANFGWFGGDDVNHSYCCFADRAARRRWLLRPWSLLVDLSPGRETGGGDSFPIVCVGGSAGGLDAYTRLLHHLPADLGAAIIIVNHLRTVATALHKILPRYTDMPVDLITEGLHIQPGRAFIIPPKRDLHVRNGYFLLKPISKPRGWPDVITIFLRSLTRNWRGKVIAVIVSGYDGDGADALCAIRDAGGITIAQTLDTAIQPDMPASAIATGCIDFTLSPENIARRIASIIQSDA